MRSMNYAWFSCVAIVSLTSVQQTLADWVGSMFDDDIDGWVEDPPQEVEITWEPSGGNTGGFLKAVDESGGSARIVAPAKFLGCWLDWEGIGAVRFDAIVLNSFGDPIESPPKVWLEGPGGKASYAFAELPTTSWQTFEVSIDEALWTVSNGTWVDLLANVEELTLLVDYVHSTGQGEQVGVDNVFVFFLGPPPEDQACCHADGTCTDE